MRFGGYSSLLLTVCADGDCSAWPSTSPGWTCRWQEAMSKMSLLIGVLRAWLLMMLPPHLAGAVVERAGRKVPALLAVLLFGLASSGEAVVVTVR